MFNCLLAGRPVWGTSFQDKFPFPEQNPQVIALDSSVVLGSRPIVIDGVMGLIFAPLGLIDQFFPCSCRAFQDRFGNGLAAVAIIGLGFVVIEIAIKNPGGRCTGRILTVEYLCIDIVQAITG